MKQIVTLALFATTLAVSARAVTVGATAGYLVDGKTGYYTAHIAHQFKSANPGIAHFAEFEIGYTHDSEGPASLDIVPVMVNYRAEFAPTGKFGAYLGAGAGASRVKINVFSFSESDSAFSYQGFAGLTYKATESTTLTLGARYLWIGDANLFGVAARVGDDVSLEAGVRIKF
ncbi:MAG: outer membrane beta-barrel protein [Opitutae bacterium]|nr:outer membrane beta-barrel protein [Opitutae bacterium]